jgi:hypothetical protein
MSGMSGSCSEDTGDGGSGDGDLGGDSDVCGPYRG